MDLSSKGAFDGVLKAAKVVVWVAVSGAVLAVAEYVRGVSVPADNVILVAELGAVNAILAGALKWLTTKQ